MIGTQLLGVRLAMLILATPLIGVIYLAALADGIAQRAVRRASGGRESSSLYHRAKYLQLLVGVSAGTGLLVLPIAIDLPRFGASVALILAMLAAVQCRYYKKHL